MVNQTIVLYPAPGIGHLISMVELGKLITKYQPSFSIKILITNPPFNVGSTAPYIERVRKICPSITFHHLPTIPLSAIPTFNSRNEETALCELMLLNNPHVHEALLAISASTTIPAFIIDTFCSSSLETANELKIPVYYFFTTNINVLSAFLYTPTVYKNIRESFKNMKDTLLEFPGVPPIPATSMVNPTLDRNDKACEWFLYFFSQLPKSRGIIVNSFESLEPRALKAVTDGLSVPDAPTPPIYCIGPLVATDRSAGKSEQVPCLEWLDSQPSRSVVFLCFGSLGLFSEAQLKEIAIGLERSGQRFLWVVRSQPTDATMERLLAPPEPDLDALLPDGFLERTKDRGLVVKTWAPQVDVLNKEAVGGFVTHAGWNSALEALCAGVPMVAWPLYAEQKMNKVIFVEALKVALPMDEEENGFVSAEEVEKRVRGLMESEEGNAIRERVVKLSSEAKAAISEGGSSVKTLNELAESWKL